MRRLIVVLALLAVCPRAYADQVGDIYVLAINGGGDKQDNFASHLAHLRQFADLISSAGIAPDHLVVLSGDGSNPAPDLATREPEPDNAWLLQGTRLESLLRDLTSYENSVLPGIPLRAATLANVNRAVAELGTRLRPGDTLLVYVTDHGVQGQRNPLDNQITLWGPREAISVRRLGALLGRLPPKVRVLSLMSQCFSGGFAYLHEVREHTALPTGETCGYFSSTSDRPAYGCYPEVRGQKGIGHSFEFLSALSRHGQFTTAQAEVMVGDETPDIPLRTSDVYLAEQLANAAGPPAREAAFVDQWLGQAWASRDFRDESKLVDRLAATYAIPRPATLADLESRADQFFAFLDEVNADIKVWEAVLGDFNLANLDAFLTDRPAWRSRLDPLALRRLDSKATLALTETLLHELDAFTARDPARLAEANRLIAALNASEELAYRTEIRVAALMRMRFIFTTVAGRLWVRGQPNQTKAVDALFRCEDLALSVPETLPRMAKHPQTSRTTLPKFEVDQVLATQNQPGWLGITFAPLGRGQCKSLGLNLGAAQIMSVAPGSPAAGAGLRRGDIVTGQPSKPFSHPNDLRPFIAAAKPGTALALEIQRGRTRLQVRATVAKAPPRPSR
jgi:hypothetical protein